MWSGWRRRGLTRPGQLPKPCRPGPTASTGPNAGTQTLALHVWLQSSKLSCRAREMAHTDIFGQLCSSPESSSESDVESDDEGFSSPQPSPREGSFCPLRHSLVPTRWRLWLRREGLGQRPATRLGQLPHALPDSPRLCGDGRSDGGPRAELRGHPDDADGGGPQGPPALSQIPPPRHPRYALDGLKILVSVREAEE